MICSTNHNWHSVLAGLFLTVLPLMGLTADMSQAVDPSATTILESRLVTRLQFKTESRPQWARFSPANPRLVLLDLDGEGLLISLSEHITRRIAKGLSPVGWLGKILVVRDQSGGFRLLDVAHLTPSRNLPVGSLPLAWTFGKDRRLRFDIALSEKATTAIPLFIPGAEISGRILSAHEDQAAVAVVSDEASHNVVDANGHIFFRGNKKIYRISLSPDTYKLLVYYGNTEYVLFNRLTKRATKLPSTLHAWTWLPDSSTLIGEVSIGEPNREEVISTDLYIYELAGARLKRIELPSSVRGVALKILDVSAEGQILVEADRVIPEPIYLGLMVIEILWR